MVEFEIIRNARNPVDKVKLIYLFMKLHDLTAKIQSFKVLEVLTIRQKFRRMMLRRKSDKVIRKIAGLRIKEHNFAMAYANLDAVQTEWINDLVRQIVTVKQDVQNLQSYSYLTAEQEIEHAMYVIREVNLERKLRTLTDDSTDVSEYVQATSD